MITLLGATISAVKIRAVTLGLDLPAPEVATAPFAEAARFLKAAMQAFEAVGLEVQTTRVAGPDLSPTLGKLGGDGLAHWTRQTETSARAVGIAFLSFGRLPATAPHICSAPL